jgi:hypothetical protein
MTPATIKLLTPFAKQDESLARKQGDVMICQTKRGTLMLRYDRDTKTYTLTTTGLNPETLAVGKPATVRPVLMAQYDVVYEDAEPDPAAPNKRNETFDMGNNERVSCGVFPQSDGTFTAMTFSQSKDGFKTLKGAERWFDRKTGRA